MDAAGVGGQIQEIGEVVRTAVAPVFLLSGVGVTLTMLTSRLARVVDRARVLEQKERDTHVNDMHVLGGALRTLEHRARRMAGAKSSSDCPTWPPMTMASGSNRASTGAISIIKSLSQEPLCSFRSGLRGRYSRRATGTL